MKEGITMKDYWTGAIVDKETTQKLEEEYQKGKLPIVDHIQVDQVDRDFIPCDKVDTELSNILEDAYQKEQIIVTEKVYEYAPGHNSSPVQEVEYDGKKYVRVVSGIRPQSNLRFSDGTIIMPETPYWFHVEPKTKRIFPFQEQKYSFKGKEYIRVNPDSIELTKDLPDSNITDMAILAQPWIEETQKNR